MTVPLAILRTAALLVPAPLREEWLAEWQSELWYVQKNAASFCIGAFRDALWVRRNNATPTLPLASPLHCLLFLVTLAAVSAVLAFRLPLPRAMLLPSPYPGARSLVMLSARGSAGRDVPSMRLDQFQALSNRTPFRFTDLAFYRPVRSGSLTLAIASRNLFDLLEVPAGTNLVLTHSAWRKYYHADPHVPATVIADGLWTLPGKIDGWVLVDPSQLRGPKGFVLARVSATAPPAHWWSFEGFDCESVAKENLLPGLLLTMMLSAFFLGVTTNFSLGEYPANRAFRFRRWLFFGCKLSLLFPIVFFGSLDVGSLLARGLQAHALIIGTVLAIRWALADQRGRCPVCLRVLSNPTRIGGASHVFLDWYGTELICPHGHGLLYIPEIPTSCYSTQRWQNLDASWSTLFS